MLSRRVIQQTPFDLAAELIQLLSFGYLLMLTVFCFFEINKNHYFVRMMFKSLVCIIYTADEFIEAKGIFVLNRIQFDIQT